VTSTVGSQVPEPAFQFSTAPKKVGMEQSVLSTATSGETLFAM
jgi:hypothetical protein